MVRRPPIAPRADPLFPYTTLFLSLIAKDRREGDIIRKRLLVIERPAGHPDVARGIEGRIEGVGIIIGLEEAVVRDTLNAVRNLILALIAAREHLELEPAVGRHVPEQRAADRHHEIGSAHV